MHSSTMLYLGIALCISSSADALTAQHISPPITFTQNCNQWDENVLFHVDAGPASLWFTRSGVLYQLPQQRADLPTSISSRGGMDVAFQSVYPERPVGLRFVGSSPTLTVEGEELLAYTCNYFYGNDPEGWITDVPNYSQITYRDLYPGIDMCYRITGRNIEYEIVVHPGARLADVRLEYTGVEEVSLSEDGRLIIHTAEGSVTESAPKMYQINAEECRTVVGSFALVGDGQFGFVADGQVDPELALVIDPILEFSSYFGGSGDETPAYGCLEADTAGNIYLIGSTSSTDLPLATPYQTDQGSGDVLITKMSTATSSLVFSTYLGGSSGDAYGGIVVADDGSVYVSGYTSSTDFPTLNPYQAALAGTDSDAFVTKLAPAGNELEYSTYLGGTDTERCWDVAIDTGGHAFVTGYTSSTNFPTANPFQTNKPFNDVFVSKLSPDGDSLIYSTYIGGDANEIGLAIDIDSTGAACICGSTRSDDFPTDNAIQPSHNGSQDDWFVTKLTPAGNATVFSTYLGGGSADVAYDLTIGPGDDLFIVGSSSGEFPLQNPYQSTAVSGDAIICRLSAGGDSLVYCTRYGGYGLDQGRAIAVDPTGRAYVVGESAIPQSLIPIPMANPIQACPASGADVFVASFTPDGDSLLFGTYFGGGSEDLGRGIAIDSTGAIYIAGRTLSTDLTLVNEYQPDQTGWDLFIAKITDTDSCNCPFQGDLNADGFPDAVDLNAIIDLLFFGGANPKDPGCGVIRADLNLDCVPDAVDFNYFVDYIFFSGPPPLLPCGQ